MNDWIGYGLGILCCTAIVICLGRMLYQYAEYKRKLRMEEDYDPSRQKGWTTVTGRFTGRVNSRPTVITKLGLKQQPYKEYEIEYYVDGIAYQKWYKFYPVPDPENIEADFSVVVAYSEKKPWIFDIVKINW